MFNKKILDMFPILFYSLTDEHVSITWFFVQVINIPARDSDNSKTFQFTVSRVADANGLDCVQQMDSK